MRRNNPKISVLIPYYNDEKFLKKSIESVLNQSFKDFELILINHASTDKSRHIAHSFSDERIVHIDFERNEGAGGGLIFGKFVEVARGQYLKPFCADDLMLETCLQDCLDFMEKNPNTDFMFADVEFINEHEKSLKKTWFRTRRSFRLSDNNVKVIRKYMKGESMMPYIGSFCKKSCFDNVKLNKTFIMLFDVHMWISLLIENKKFKYLNKIIAQYRIHSNQMSAKNRFTKASQQSYYEAFACCKVFFEFKDIDLLKLVMEKDKFAQQLTEYDEDFVTFVVAYNLFKHSKNPSYEAIGYSKLQELLACDTTRDKIYKKFNFSIKDLRTLYSFIKERPKLIYFKHPKELNVFELVFLIFRHLFNLITLRALRLKLKRLKTYTV